MKPISELAYCFDSFQLFPTQQVLLENGQVCPIGSRALEILICLIERAGQIVTKQELVNHVWPDTFVHEANLRVNVSGLRKALGDGRNGRRFILNVTGQGYSFVGLVRSRETAPPRDLPPPKAAARHNLPIQAGQPLGREADIDSVTLHVPMRRCVTIAGPGGMGKTTVAVAVAERLLRLYDDGVWFVDLSAVSDGHMITPTVAHVLGLSLQAGNSLTTLANYLADKRLLLVLDNCEHVIDGAASLAETVLSVARDVAILATSRETLRIGNEWVHWLPPLEMPSSDYAVSVEEALLSPAVRLFVDCAAANLDDFTLRPEDVAVVVDICRRLDGLPLGIQLAAARVDIFGLKGLAAVLDDPFVLLTEGRRGALPRQQNLLRTLEWSYRLLTPVEQAVLRRLSVFRGDFTLDGALAVAEGGEIDAEHIYSSVLTLSAKSLIRGDILSVSEHPHHRMLHVTRTYLSQKLENSDELRDVSRRHACFLLDLLAKAEAHWGVFERLEWTEIYGGNIADIRSAIDWAFSPEGDPALGVRLTAAALPLGYQLSQIHDFRGRVERALLNCRRIEPPQPLAEMRLNIALGVLTHNISGPAGRTAAYGRAIEISLQLDRPVYQAEPLLGLAVTLQGSAAYQLTIEAASEAWKIGQAAQEPMAVLAAERILAQAHHFNGDLDRSERLAQQVIDHPAPRLPLIYCIATPVHRRISMQIIRARNAWLRGRPAAADEHMEAAMRLARCDGVFSLCPTLTFGSIPLALWNGQDELAKEFTMLLAEQSKRFSLEFWAKWVSSFEAILKIRSGERDFQEITPDFLQQPETFATFCPDLLVPEAVFRADSGACGWCAAEIRRIQGEWLLAERSAGGVQAAEALFREAVDLAVAQGAVAWELRAAVSLGRLLRSTGRIEEARRVVAKPLGRVQPGCVTADIEEATALLQGIEKGQALQDHGGVARRQVARRGEGGRR